MKERLSAHLRAERRAAALYLLMGSLSAVAGSLLWVYQRSAFFQGFALSTLILAVLLLLGGIHILRQTARLAGRLPAQLQLHPARFREEELRRCAGRQRRYGQQGNLSLLLVLLGMTLAMIGGVISPHAFTMGMGFGLCGESAILLVLDLSTQWRTRAYQHELERFDGHAE